jgi:hypothetical protein
MSELSDEEVLRRLTEATEERARILADPTRAEPVLHPDKYADPVGFDDEGRPLPDPQPEDASEEGAQP